MIPLALMIWEEVNAFTHAEVSIYLVVLEVLGHLDMKEPEIQSNVTLDNFPR